MSKQDDVLEKAKKAIKESKETAEGIRIRRQKDGRFKKDEEAEEKLAEAFLKEKEAEKFGDVVRSQYPDREFPVGDKDLPKTTKIAEVGSMQRLYEYSPASIEPESREINNYLEEQALRRFGKKEVEDLSDEQYKQILGDRNSFEKYIIENRMYKFLSELGDEILLLSGQIDTQLAETYRLRKDRKKNKIDITIEEVMHNDPEMVKLREDFELVDSSTKSLDTYISEHQSVLSEDELRILKGTILTKRHEEKEKKWKEFLFAEESLLLRIKSTIKEVAEQIARQKADSIRERPNNPNNTFTLKEEDLSNIVEEIRRDFIGKSK